MNRLKRRTAHKSAAKKAAISSAAKKGVIKLAARNSVNVQTKSAARRESVTNVIHARKMDAASKEVAARRHAAL